MRITDDGGAAYNLAIGNSKKAFVRFVFSFSRTQAAKTLGWEMSRGRKSKSWFGNAWANVLSLISSSRVI